MVYQKSETGSIPGVDGVFVLTVKIFEERIRHIKNHFGEFAINFDFVFAFDPPELTSDCISRYFVEGSMGLPHYSLVMKHIYAWRLGVERNCNKVLVFEDDAILDKKFLNNIKKVIAEASKLEPGYLIYLGGYDTKVPDSFFLEEGLLVSQQIATAEGYLCDLESLRRRLQWLEKNKVSLPADHLIKHIDEDCGIAQYWTKEPLVQQGSVFGLFTSYLDKNRLKHSRYYNYLRYYWHRFWRRIYRRWLIKLKNKCFQ